MRLHIIASAVLFGIGAATLAVSAEGEDTNSREATFRQLELFGDVLSRIESDYVTEPVNRSRVNCRQTMKLQPAS